MRENEEFKEESRKTTWRSEDKNIKKKDFEPRPRGRSELLAIASVSFVSNFGIFLYIFLFKIPEIGEKPSPWPAPGLCRSPIEYANDVFSPPAKEVEKAHRIIEELKKAAAEGKGAAQLDGRMIDAASEKMAENIININNLIESKK